MVPVVPRVRLILNAKGNSFRSVCIGPGNQRSAAVVQRSGDGVRRHAPPADLDGRLAGAQPPGGAVDGDLRPGPRRKLNGCPSAGSVRRRGAAVVDVDGNCIWISRYVNNCYFLFAANL